jgi:hypothetical protein
MQKIYQNFDKLEISFQCCVPQYVLDVLKVAKEAALQSRRSELAYIGKNDLPVMVAETGAKGGYSYRFDTGLDGMIWMIAPSQDLKRWNVRMSAKSLMLALYGYEETKKRILKTLIEDLEVIFSHNDENNYPLERVSRFDYCFDFISDNFTPDSTCFTAHNRSIKECIFKTFERGRRLETITVGQIPNKQITIYNKGREIISSAKMFWWDIWSLNKKEFEGNIWRVEIRAGKKELNKYKIKRLIDFEKSAGDVIIDILNTNRYVIPNIHDKNTRRWKNTPFWNECIKSTKYYLSDYISNTQRNKVITGYKEEMKRTYEVQLSGMFTAYSALIGQDVSKIPGVLDLIVSDFLERIAKNPEKYRKKYKKSEERFILLK